MADKQDLKITEEEIDATGQDSEIKAAKWVKEKGKEVEIVEQDQKNHHLSDLEKKTHFKFEDYKRYLVNVMYTELLEMAFPKSYQIRPFIDDKGVGVALRTPDKRNFVRAFAPVNIPKYDLNAALELVYTAESKIKALEDGEKTPSGILTLNGRNK